MQAILLHTAVLKKLKISNNNGISWAICTKIWSAPVYVKIKLNVTLFALVWPQNLCHRQTAFLVKIEKSCSGYSETCKSVKNRKSKIFPITILFSYTEYRKKLKFISTDVYTDKKNSESFHFRKYPFLERKFFIYNTILFRSVMTPTFL